jgi:SAM-dependent methyltransferase
MGFSAAWLSLREPADIAARDHALLSAAAACVPANGAVLDLGSGTGSTARAFAAGGFDGLRWRFFDNDPSLLAEAARQTPKSEQVLGDLADVAALPLEGVSLVTASALLDLMSQSWVDALAERLWRERIPFYAALSYDGQMRWTPELPLDASVTHHFNLHQCTDKGIGAALGPDSGVQSAHALRSRGFDLVVAQSPWILGAPHAKLHIELLQGIGEAAAEAGLDTAPAWTQARRATAAQSEGIIGHTDILARIPERAAA